MQGRCFAVKKRKKKIALAVAAVLVVLAGAAAVYFACMPDLTVYYNASDGAAWQVQTKTGVRQKIELPGYENVSLVTPFDGGWYACAEKGGQSYFVLVQGGQVCGELSVQTLGSGGHVDEMYAADGGLYASCFTGENVKMLFADFENAQVSELPAEQTNYPTYLCAAGRTVLLGGIGRDNVPRLYRYQGGQLQALVAGGEPVLLNETQFLYTDDESGDLMLYDLTAGTSQPAGQKVDFSKYRETEWDVPAVAGKYLAGVRSGFSYGRPNSLFSGVTVTDMESGFTFWLPTMLGQQVYGVKAVCNT